MIQLQAFNTLSSDFSQSLTLGTIVVKIRLVWNIRSGFWTMSVIDANENHVAGIKLVPNYLLLRHHRALLPVPGDLILIRENPYAQEFPTFENLGSAFNLYFLDEDEVIEWEDTNGLG